LKPGPPVVGGEGGGVCLPGHKEELPGRRVHSLATGWKVSITLNIKGQCHEIFDLRFSVDSRRGVRVGLPSYTAKTLQKVSESRKILRSTLFMRISAFLRLFSAVTQQHVSNQIVLYRTVLNN
jgi:hypothetical protein